jgi:hypothetical protein
VKRRLLIASFAVRKMFFAELCRTEYFYAVLKGYSRTAAPFLLLYYTKNKYRQ